MACTHDALVIKHWHCLYPAMEHVLRLATIDVKMNLDSKPVCSGSCVIMFLARV